MQNLIPVKSLSDFEGEARIRDLDLASRLGYSKPYDIRLLIVRNLDELEAYGPIPCRAENLASKGGRPSKAYWLSEGQALALCALARTPTAQKLRKALVDVFKAYREGLLVQVQEQEHRRRLPKRTGMNPCDMASQKAFVRAFLQQKDGLETLLASTLVGLAEIRSAK